MSYMLAKSFANFHQWKRKEKKTKKQINPYSHECVIDYNQDLTIT